MTRIPVVVLCAALAACSDEAPVAAAPPPPPAATPAPSAAAVPIVPPRPLEPARFTDRCVAVAARHDTDAAVLAADRRICECMGRTLKPVDFDLMLNFMEIDPARPDHEASVNALYDSYAMSDTQFATQLNRIRAAGRPCRSP
jgi:hypothetical protein